jgi:hypothetical protein
LIDLPANPPPRRALIRHLAVTANSASALVPANVLEYFAVTPGQVLNFISTSTSTGYVVLTEMT